MIHVIGRSRRIVIAAALVLAAAVVGCGGSSEGKKETPAWNEQAESICRDAAKQVAKLPDDLGTDPDGPGRAKERKVLDEKLRQLREVDVPADVAADYKRMLELSTQSASANTRFLQTAGNAADPNARADSVRQLKAQKRLGDQTSAIARDLDLGDCAGA